MLARGTDVLCHCDLGVFFLINSTGSHLAIMTGLRLAYLL